MSDRRLIAFDLGGTLELYQGRPVFDDMQPALSEYAAQYPDTSFGIATNGKLEPAVRFVEEQGIADLFWQEGSRYPLIAHAGQIVATPVTTSVPVPVNWRERLSGRFTGSEQRTIDQMHTLQPKPHPDILNRLMYLTGATPDYTVFVGDDRHDDLPCAEEAGVNFVLYDPFAPIGERPGSMAELLQQAHQAFPNSL